MSLQQQNSTWCYCAASCTAKACWQLASAAKIGPLLATERTSTLTVNVSCAGTVLAGVIEENGGRVINSNITVGDAFTMPQVRRPCAAIAAPLAFHIVQLRVASWLSMYAPCMHVLRIEQAHCVA